MNRTIVSGMSQTIVLANISKCSKQIHFEATDNQNCLPTLFSHPQMVIWDLYELPFHAVVVFMTQA